MEVVILPDEAALGILAADAIEAVVQSVRHPVLGLATGSSPLPVYREVIARVGAARCSLADASAFTLDEYVGLPLGHPASYREVIRADFTDHVDIPESAVHAPDGSAGDLTVAAAAYETALRDAGGVDVQLLGIGTDGHIAFNEPGSSLASRTRIKTLTEQTREDNARFFDSLDEVPRHCLTQGLGTISEARHVILLATGVQKAPAVAHLVEGPVSARWPATVLQWHPHCTVLLDEEAVSELELAGYYRHAYENKPGSQGL